MAIIRRSAVTTGQAIEPKKREYVPDPKALSPHFPKGHEREFVYLTFAQRQNPKGMAIEDLAVCLRLADDPGHVTETASRDRIKGRLSAVRAFCLRCTDGPKNVRMCVAVTCPLWSFRMGTNPFYKKR